VDIPEYESSAGFSIVDYRQSDHNSGVTFDIDCASQVESEILSIPNHRGDKKLGREKKPILVKTKEQKKLEKKEKEENFKAQHEVQKKINKVSQGNNKINQTY